MKQRDSSRLVVEFTHAAVRVLAASGAPAQPQVRHLSSTPLQDAAALAALRRTLEALRPRPAACVVAIPRDQVITRLLRLPATQPDELRGMALLAGKAQLPYPAEQTHSDVTVISDEGGTSTVQLVACHRDVVDRHLAWLHQIGCEPQVMTPSSWGLWQWCVRIAPTPDAALVVHVDDDHTDVVVVHRGRLVFSRALAQGVRQWRDQPGGLGALATELQRSREALAQEWSGVDAGAVLLTGAGPLEAWAAQLSPLLRCPVAARAPAEGWTLPPSWDQQAASPAILLGLAAGPPDVLVNLLPSEIRRRHAAAQRARQWRVTAAWLAASCVAGVGVLAASAHRDERFLAQAAPMLRALEGRAARTQQRERQVRLIEQTLASRRSTAALLEELFKRTPPAVVFEQLLFERARGELVVRGVAPETREVLEYVHQLEHVASGTQVELRYSGRRGAGASARTEFELVVRQRAGS